VFFGFLKQAVVRIALNSKSSCLSLPSAGIPDVYQHTWHIFNLGELIVWYYNESLSGVATMNPSVQQIYPNFKNTIPKCELGLFFFFFDGTGI
jgi:hypothetical protein